MKIRPTGEQGFAMITALVVSTVVFFLGLVVVNQAVHSSNSSAFDRDRVQAIDAGEAGIDAYLSALKTDVGSTTCSPMDGDLPTSPPAHYHVTVQLYSVWPPTDGSEMSCPPPAGTDPAGALVTSKGTTTSARASSVSRTMETEIRLTPIYSGLGQAIFSNNLLNFQNKLTLNGNISNDADVYTNGNFSMGNNTVISGTVYAQGYASINQGVAKQDIWANSYVDLHNLSVLGKITSSTSYNNLDATHVYGSAKAGTTITLSNNSVVDGGQTPSSPSGAPPLLQFPRITYDPTVWQKAGYVVVPYASCALAQAFISAVPAGNYVVRVSPTCAMSWGNNSTVNIPGNLAIITDGSFTTVNQTTWNGTGGAHTLFIIRPYQSGLACSPTPSPYDFNVSNNTSFNSLNVLVYDQCTINFGNNNAGGFNGQIIGGNVNITNQMVMNYRPIVVPGFNVTGYTPDVSYLRETTNS